MRLVAQIMYEKAPLTNSIEKAYERHTAFHSKHLYIEDNEQANTSQQQILNRVLVILDRAAVILDKYSGILYTTRIERLSTRVLIDF